MSSPGGSELNGALHDASSASHYLLVQGGGFEAGVSPSAMGFGSSQSVATPSVGGYLSFTSDSYQLGATFHPLLAGGVAARLYAGVGAAPGLPGTSYGLSVGTVSGAGFSVNPASRLGYAAVNGLSPNDVNLSFTVNHVLTSGVSLMGTAEARRGLGISQADAEAGLNPTELLIGAGLGMKF